MIRQAVHQGRYQKLKLSITFFKTPAQGCTSYDPVLTMSNNTDREDLYAHFVIKTHPLTRF